MSLSSLAKNTASLISQKSLEKNQAQLNSSGSNQQAVWKRLQINQAIKNLTGK